MQSRILHIVLFATLLSGASIANAQLLDGPRKLTRGTPGPKVEKPVEEDWDRFPDFSNPGPKAEKLDEHDWSSEGFTRVSDADVDRIKQAKTAADVEQITQELIAAAKERRPTIFWNPLFVMLGWGERLIEIGWYAWLSGIAKTFVLIALARLVLNIARSVRAAANARTPNDKHTTLEALKPTPHEEAQEQMTNNNTRADNELVRSSQLLNSPSPNAAANHESFKMEPPEAGNTLLNSSLTAIMTRLITLVQQQNATTKAALLLSGGVILGGLLVPWLTSSGSTSSSKWEIKHVESPARRESATYKVNERTGETYLLTNGAWVKVNTLDTPK
ncbi:MAG: hypothetical protein NT013_23465 [Planctomycetia bacterium]|nr:hypothetical protein [Planctomycetia bacterium]